VRNATTHIVPDMEVIQIELVVDFIVGKKKQMEVWFVEIVKELQLT
jgi:hypothetical protein